MTGIGSVAKMKSVNMLIATFALVIRFHALKVLPTAIEQPDSSKGVLGIATRFRRSKSKGEVPCCIHRQTLKYQGEDAGDHENNQEYNPPDYEALISQ